VNEVTAEGLAYLDDGPSDGEVVVLLHGWPTSAFLWRRLIPLLRTRFRVLAPETTGADLREQAEGVLGLLRSLGVERFAAIGHSWGGGVAQLLALADAGVDALVLIDSIGFDQAPPTDLDARTFVERGTVELADLAPEDLTRLAASTEPPPGPLDLTAESGSMAGWHFPVFLLWGEDDPYTPVALAERLGDAIPAATLGVVPDSGHFLLEDAFDSVGVLIYEYLRSRYLGAPHGHEGVVMLQLERRSVWSDLDADRPEEDLEPVPLDPADQEVGPNA
jgi:pimeloyl-ACP methyl ester carboxylesterase